VTSVKEKMEEKEKEKKKVKVTEEKTEIYSCRNLRGLVSVSKPQVMSLDGTCNEIVQPHCTV